MVQSPVGLGRSTAELRGRRHQHLVAMTRTPQVGQERRQALVEVGHQASMNRTVVLVGVEVDLGHGHVQDAHADVGPDDA